MTATTVQPWVRTQGAVAPAPAAALARVTGTLHEPNAWTVGILLATGVVLIARHPIAHMLGTEVDVPPVATVATAPVGAHPAAQAPALSLPLAAAPTHAPRDPFRALVSATGKVLAPGAAPVAAPVPAAAVPAVPVAAAPAVPSAPATTPTSTCTGATHRVVAGDTLWTIAARAVHSSNSDRVTLAWHRLYAANRATLGANPGLLQVGESLCVPTSL